MEALENNKSPANIETSQYPQGFSVARPEGIEPSTFGLEIRWLLENALIPRGFLAPFCGLPAGLPGSPAKLQRLSLTVDAE